jgi:hypothetical protein
MVPRPEATLMSAQLSISPAAIPGARPVFLPHIDQLLQALRISRERLNSRSKVAIDTRLLRILLHSLAGQLPFDPEFYLDSNADVAAAYESGSITDLHRHFIETGFIEGRFGAAPEVDEPFYAASYKDIGAAIRRGEVASARDHYVRAGAAEGRIPSEAMRQDIERWASVLSE